ncbi:MAG: hypothetical protein HY529_01895 [Chloroflexi bacterium]|nr:hypothetical protein [Chloroflexota bacterium]
MKHLFGLLMFISFTLLILSFLGVQPLTYYKDRILTKIESFLSNAEEPSRPGKDEPPSPSVPPEIVPNYPSTPPVTKKEEQDVPIATPLTFPTTQSITSSVPQRGLLDVRSTTVTAVLEFTEGAPSGFYLVTLASGEEVFGTKKLDWYRRKELLKLDWEIVAGTQAFYHLREGENPQTLFKVRVSYKEFYSTTSSSSAILTTLEEETFRRINELRKSNELSPLVWKADLYNLAKDFIQEVGKEGKLVSSTLSSEYTILVYESSSSNMPTAGQLVSYWLRFPELNNLVNSEEKTSLIVKVDTYSNNKFYAVAIFSK